MSDGKSHVIRLTREELYEQVWATPMRLLAKSYGISDVGLAKVCKRHMIPKPPLGYWAKKQFGKAPPRPKLPVMHDPMLNHVEFMACPGRDTSAPHVYFDPSIAEMVAAEAREQIVVPAQLRDPHRFVVATREWFQQSTRRTVSDEPAIRASGKRDRIDVLDIDVTQSTLGRTLRILNSLVKTFDLRGFKIRLQNDEWKRATFVSIMGREFRFRVRERLRRVDHVPTKEELDRHKRHFFIGNPPKWDFVASGLLELHVFSEHNNYWPLRSWRDTDKRLLEARLNEVIPFMLGWIDREKAEHAKRLAEAREKAERERQEREAEQQRQREKARIDNLVLQAESWHKSQSIREYLWAVRQTAEEQYGLIDPDGECGTWLAWAENVATSFDPLATKPHGHGDAPIGAECA